MRVSSKKGFFIVRAAKMYLDAAAAVATANGDEFYPARYHP